MATLIWQLISLHCYLTNLSSTTYFIIVIACYFHSCSSELKWFLLFVDFRQSLSQNMIFKFKKVTSIFMLLAVRIWLAVMDVFNRQLLFIACCLHAKERKS